MVSRRTKQVCIRCSLPPPPSLTNRHASESSTRKAWQIGDANSSFSPTQTKTRRQLFQKRIRRVQISTNRLVDLHFGPHCAGTRGTVCSGLAVLFGQAS